MLLKLGTITAKFHQGPRALINLLVQISAGQRERERSPRKGVGGGVGGRGGAGGQVINNSRDRHNGQRGPFCSAHGAPCEAPCTQLLQTRFHHHLRRAWRSRIIWMVVNASPGITFWLYNNNKKWERKETNRWSGVHHVSATVSLSFSMTILNGSDLSQWLICYHLLWHF